LPEAIVRIGLPGERNDQEQDVGHCVV
jgi:hypothetical protein